PRARGRPGRAPAGEEGRRAGAAGPRRAQQARPPRPRSQGGSMPDVWYALSVKQPWAALLAAGVKTVEVRTWPTGRRGRLLIHAGKVPDERPEAWAWVTTPALKAAAELRGGVVGVGELTGCV